MKELNCTYCDDPIDVEGGMIYCSDPDCGAVWWPNGEVDRPGASAEEW